MILLLILLTLLFAWVSRMCGGGWPSLPWGLDQWVYALPYGLFSLWACLQSSMSLLLILLLFSLAYFGAFAAKRTGHGQYIDLGSWVRKIVGERLDFILDWFFDEDPNEVADNVKGSYWRDVAGQALTGFAVSLACGVVIATVSDLLIGVLIAFSGLLKAPAYMVGWMIFPNGKDDDDKDEELDEATELGEFFTGLFCIGALAALFYILYSLSP